VRRLERQRQTRTREKIEKQRVTLRVLAPAAPDVRVKRAALQKQREGRLIEKRQMIVAQMFELDESVEQSVRHHDVSQSERWKEDFAERAGVDQTPARIETLQTRQGRGAVTQLGV